MADKPFFIGESMFSFPVFISETLDQANNSIIKIIQMSTLISVSAEIVKINKEIQISCITIQAWNGPTYIFDVLTGGFKMMNSPRGLKMLLECPFIMKIVFDCKALSSALWKTYKIQLSYVADAAFAFRIYENLPNTRKISRNELCKKLVNTEIPFYRDIESELTKNNGFWTQRPLLYHMHSYVSGFVTLLLKAWEDLRSYLSDDQVYQVFQNTQTTIANLYPSLKQDESTETSQKHQNFEFKSTLENFVLDKISVEFLLNRAIKPNNLI